MLALLRFSWKPSSRLQYPLLPQELIDQILDYLFDDVDTLRSCSSVSPGWLDSARHHLFKKFTFVAKAGPNGASFAQFAVFLKDSSSVCKHVRTLHLHGGSLSTTPVGAADSLAIPDFAGIVSLLPSLREVKLSRMSIIPEVCQTPSLPLNVRVISQYFLSKTHPPTLPFKLHKLALSQVSFTGDPIPLTISDFLRTFRCIDLIEAWNVTAPPDIPWSETPILDIEDIGPIAPRTLCIGSFQLERNSVRVQSCLLQIARVGSSRSLHTLDVHLDSSEDEEALQGLINAAGSALRNLSVNVMSKTMLPRMAPRELRLLFNVQRWPFSLEQIVSYKWRKIQITLLEMAPHIPEVVIVFYYAYMRGTVGEVEANFIRRELGLLDERGLLTIV
ncbi:hypothetical protein NLI96_g11016 [Meripilus lineatus]|uniref:F-box domain-containing protein n=1 Tax=Meripilus lineatus TaxID=2056292 RepID=A0AAD5YBE4_9APHY|nr:hypothetical protein NLI96_g11016 [Physisporinus lineatus]